MAAHDSFQDDQTDEDFFDKLVDDDFDAAEERKMARELSNLSIGDDSEADNLGRCGTSDGQLSDVGFAAEDEKQQEWRSVDDSAAAAADLVDPVPGESPEKQVAVKEVQWSSFYAASPQFGMEEDGFASYTDAGISNDTAFTEDHNLGSDIANNVEFTSHTAGLSNSFDFSSSIANTNSVAQPVQQLDAQDYSWRTDEQIAAATDVNDPQYWENMYPGWKYDVNTGQWYQASDNSENAVAHDDEVSANVQLDSLVQATGGEVVTQIAKPAEELLTMDASPGVVNNWNQVSQESTVYPPNMVFDPQYPGWYYDTNTQQWYTLDSYAHSIQGMGESQMGENHNASDCFASKDNSTEYNNVNTYTQNIIQENSSVYGSASLFQQDAKQGHISQQTTGNWDPSVSNYSNASMWQGKMMDDKFKSLPNNSLNQGYYGQAEYATNYSGQAMGFKSFEPVSTPGYRCVEELNRIQTFVPTENTSSFSQPKAERAFQANITQSYYRDHAVSGYSPQHYQGNEARSSAGRPPHTLVTFGFGGKLIVVKESPAFSVNMDHRNQDAGGTVSVLSLMEILKDRSDAFDCSYFSALYQQSFPGPLVGGSAAVKDVTKWTDEKISDLQFSILDPRKGELLKLLLSLLKISCQHYGKLRSPMGSDASIEETDGPEAAVIKLFSSCIKNGTGLGESSFLTNCMQIIPSEVQMQTAALEVQNLLVSGRRKDALLCAQQGQLWGPALVLAAQLGEKFYIETVKQMAHHQFICGTPLRTLCLLIAGQSADVFSTDGYNVVQHPEKVQVDAMLDDWIENLAVITANRTKNDELVIVHLGDCLWKERGEVTAAHTCYLVAEANIEPYSDNARLCLVGADHIKCPRTYASPEAIQRTEIYEYSKVLGNSQFTLLPFQPYKIIYAYMLAEVGKVSDSLRYCQASLKALKNCGRAPELENLKMLATSLEERLRTHQQGGYSTNLDPTKFVGRFFTSIDRSIHRMMGAPTSPLPPLPPSNINSNENYHAVPKVVNSQSTLTMSSLIASPSAESVSDLKGDSRKMAHNRSVSEPDFGRSPMQNPSKDAGSPVLQSEGSGSRFGRIGSQFLQKTMGWVSRSHPDRQAKLGERNKFHYDEKLKRWVEEGVEPPSEEIALPPPPISSPLQNEIPNYNINNALKGTSTISNGGSEGQPLNSSDFVLGTLPISPTPNQFSARGQIGLRSRYVDTFNKGGQNLTGSFHLPSVASAKTPHNAKFFVPTSSSTYNEQKGNATEGIIHDRAIDGDHSGSSVSRLTLPSPRSTASSSFSIQRFPSMDEITPKQGVGSFQLSRARAASWSGSYDGMSSSSISGTKPAGDGLSFSTPSNSSAIHHSSSTLHTNGRRLGNDLHEVELG